MLELQDEWVWDSWYAWQGETLHAFYLKAPKSLGDPNLRHHNARVGHSTSSDGITWQHHADALAPNASESFDDQAIWTGSVLHHAGVWHMFFTGIDRRTKGRIQRVGHATSTDLFDWVRVGSEPILTAAAPNYAVAELDPRGEEPFRDPWVFWHAGEWHMLVTARAAGDDTAGAGNMAHATSPDLFNWTLRQPLISASGFDQLEVFQVVEVEGNWFLIFCTGALDVRRAGVPKAFATYAAPAAGPLGPFDLDGAKPIPESGGVYAARVVRFPDASQRLIGFLDSGEPGGFQGVIGNPKKLRVDAEGALVFDVE